MTVDMNHPFSITKLEKIVRLLFKVLKYGTIVTLNKYGLQLFIIRTITMSTICWGSRYESIVIMGLRVILIWFLRLPLNIG